MKIKTSILILLAAVLGAVSVGLNVWFGRRLYSLQESHKEMTRTQADQDMLLQSLYDTAMFIGGKFDELDAIFVEYDQLVSELDNLFIEDCYSYNVESTNRMYQSIADRYYRLADRYDLLMDDIEDFSRQLEDELADFELAL